jgi:sulfopyruvate decarboxylase TPP-binding subunit
MELTVKAETPPRTWPGDIYKAFKRLRIQQVAYVPDAGHTQLILDCHGDNDIKTVSLTTEQEGVAMLSGAWLGGQRGALLMQSSGAGNCMNMLSLAHECRFPMLMLVTMRGDWGEFNPWQIIMGQNAGTLLEQSGCIVQRVDRADEVGEVVFAGGQMSFSTGRPVAILIGQRVIGFKDWSK